MECNKDEAIRAKNIAESKMTYKDFEAARKFALKAQKLFPELDNISQMLAVCDVHCSAQRKINGAQMDLYGILQVECFADEATIRKQYLKLALVLHPDKNHFPGAEAAFKLIGEANMILSDKGKRNLHDFKCRETAKPTVSKHQDSQEIRNPQSVSNIRPSFWTFCPFCKFEYEYDKDLLKRIVKCANCLQIFTAIDIRPRSTQAPKSGQPGMQNANPRSNSGQPASCQQEEAGKNGNANVDGKKADPQCTRTGDAKVDNSRDKTVEDVNTKTKKGKERVAFTETKGNSSVASDSSGKKVDCRKRSRKRSQVRNSEEVVDDISPEKKSRPDKQKDKVCDTDELKKNKMKEKDVKSNADSEDGLEPVYFDVQDPEFSNFDKAKEENCFAVDQFWAVYDTIDSMPRFYAQIKKVYAHGFRLRINWLEADPQNRLEKTWSEEGLPVACGRFKRGETEETSDRLMFSHQIAVEKGNKRSSFLVYPKKGEIWALFKNWDMNWSSDPENHMKYKFEIVEILSDFDKNNGVLVAYMAKVEGFLFLFQKTNCAGLSEHQIPSSEIFRFSHHIPSLKLTGMERADVPAGSCELDPASLPDDLDQYYLYNNVKVSPENVSASCPRSPEREVIGIDKETPNLRTSPQGLNDNFKSSTGDKNVSASCPRSPEREVIEIDEETPNLRTSPRGLNGNFKRSIGVKNKSSIATSSKGNNQSCEEEEDNDVSMKSTEFSSSLSGKEGTAIHDFDFDKQNRKFQEGQIWALKENLICYAQIRKIEPSPLKLHVVFLELCSDAIRPNSCGLYKCFGKSQIAEQDSFLYPVKAEVNGKNRFNIYPREKEIWILCKNSGSYYTFSGLDAGDYEIVEVVENNGDTIKVLSLSHVRGYKSVFRALKSVLEMPIADSNLFFYRVPAFLLTDEQDGQLRGCWELDLAEFPGLL